jgi:hypothetical protein
MEVSQSHGAGTKGSEEFEDLLQQLPSGSEGGAVSARQMHNGLASIKASNAVHTPCTQELTPAIVQGAPRKATFAR